MVGWSQCEIENDNTGDIFITGYQISEGVIPYQKLNTDVP